MSKKSLAALALAVLALAGCASGGSGGGSGGSGGSGAPGDTIKIGASLPLTGALASFGPILQAGYQAAVDEVNAAGGLSADGQSHQVELVVLDSASDPNKVTDQSRTLVEQNGAVGLLGSISPALTVPASTVADLEKVPMVSTLTPNQAWKAGNPSGWQYAWNMFFDEQQISDVSFGTADLAQTTKKIAIFANTDEDGIANGALWEDQAPKHGYTIAYRADFPAGTTDFTAQINQAKAAGADILFGVMIPPDAFALWKQMKALAWDPQVAFCQKCNSQAAFQGALGELAEGASVVYLANPSDAAEYAQVTARFQKEYGRTVDATSALASYSAAKVLLDAIATAGSTDPDKVNAAIGSTKKEYPIGNVSFTDHVFSADVAGLQWQGDAQVSVFPAGSGGTLQAPVKGLQ